MKAQVLYDINNIIYTEVDKPVPSKEEALVKVTRCGICGSDIPRIYKTGAHNMPLIPGHEFTGTVMECDLNQSLIGKRTAVFPLIPCKECDQCKVGHYEMCKNYDYLGSRSNGGFAQYVRVPVWNLMPIPDEVTDDEAAMLEPMCVAVHAMIGIGLEIVKGADSKSNSKSVVAINANTRKEPSIVICGLGTIGLLLAMFVKDAGYKNVFLIGNKDIQKKAVIDIGYDIDYFCDVRYDDPITFVMDRTNGHGCDYYFECIGRSENYGQAVSCSAPLGNVMLVGNPASDMNLSRDIYWKILRNQLTLKGTWNSSYGVEGDDWSYVINRLSAWKKTDLDTISFSPSKLITHRFNLEHMQEGLDIMRMKSQEYIKVMIEIS